jgi:hypothetical protein
MKIFEEGEATLAASIVITSLKLSKLLIENRASELQGVNAIH